MEVPQGIKNRTSNHTSMYISKGKETIIWKTYLYCHVHCSIIHNSQGMETTKYFSIDEWIKKMWYVCVYIYIHIYVYIYMYIYIHTQWNISDRKE